MNLIKDAARWCITPNIQFASGALCAGMIQSIRENSPVAFTIFALWLLVAVVLSKKQ